MFDESSHLRKTVVVRTWYSEAAQSQEDRVLTHERTESQQTSVHLPQQLPLFLRVVLGIPFPEIHPRLPWRSLGRIGGSNHAGAELACPSLHARGLVPGVCCCRHLSKAWWVGWQSVGSSSARRSGLQRLLFIPNNVICTQPIAGH